MMATIRANGVDLHYVEDGAGEPVVFVHGSWGDADNWAVLTPVLANEHRIIAYDRRGHTRSELPAGQGSIHDDVDDLAAIIEKLGPAPVHVVGNSWGAIISLRCAAKYPELFRTVAAHEPPMLALLAGDTELASLVAENQAKLQIVRELLEAGKNEEGAHTFVNTIALGPGVWENMFTDAIRDRFTNNAPTYLDECKDPDQLTFDPGSLKGFAKPILLTRGTTSPAVLPAVVMTLAAHVPAARQEVIEGAGHVPHFTHPKELADLLRDHWAKAR